MAFMVSIAETGRAWKGAGALRARPAWNYVSEDFWMRLLGRGVGVFAHIVDEDVDSAELFDGGCHGCVDGLVVADVGCFVDDLALGMGILELFLQSG